MNNFLTKNPLVFLLGAGFDCDATCEAGQTRPFPSGRPPRYPLVSDLLDICFGLDALPPDKSVEDLFQDSIKNRDRKPLEVSYEQGNVKVIRNERSHDHEKYISSLESKDMD